MGPGRRAWQLASAVAAEGHETRLLWVDPQPAGVSPGRTLEAASLGNRSIEETYIRCADLGREGARECLEAPRSDAIVAATVHASAWVAKNAPQDIPLWFDVFGDPLAEAQAKAAADGNEEASIPRGQETILLVEDEAPVRLTARNILERCGYRVLEAGSGVEALAVWHQHQPG